MSSLHRDQFVNISGIDPSSVAVGVFNEGLTVFIQLCHNSLQGVFSVVVVSNDIVSNLWWDADWYNVSLVSIAHVAIVNMYLALVVSLVFTEGALEPSTSGILLVPLHEVSVVDSESLGWWVHNWGVEGWSFKGRTS